MGQFLKVVVVNDFNMFNVVMLNFTSFKVKEEKFRKLWKTNLLLFLPFTFTFTPFYGKADSLKFLKFHYFFGEGSNGRFGVLKLSLTIDGC